MCTLCYLIGEYDKITSYLDNNALHVCKFSIGAFQRLRASALKSDRPIFESHILTLHFNDCDSVFSFIIIEIITTSSWLCCEGKMR